MIQKMKSTYMNIVIIHFSSWLLPPSAQSPELLHWLRLQSSCMLHTPPAIADRRQCSSICSCLLKNTTIIPTDSACLVHLISTAACSSAFGIVGSFVWFHNNNTISAPPRRDVRVAKYRLASARFLRLDLVLLTRTNIKHLRRLPLSGRFGCHPITYSLLLWRRQPTLR